MMNHFLGAITIGFLTFIALKLDSINQKLTVITENFKTNAPHIKAED